MICDDISHGFENETRNGDCKSCNIANGLENSWNNVILKHANTSLLFAAPPTKKSLHLYSHFLSFFSFLGILVQLPLPPHIHEQTVLDEIEVEKDVDGLHPLNLARLAHTK